MKKIKFSALCEQLAGDKRLPRHTRARLLEDEAYGPIGTDTRLMDQEVPEPMKEQDPMDALKDGFRAALQVAIDQALDGDTEALKKVNELIRTHGKITAKSAAAKDTEEEDDDEKKDTEEDASEPADTAKLGSDSTGGGQQHDKGLKGSEGKKGKAPRPDATLLTEAKARSLCKLADVEADASLLESLIGTPESKALKLLEWAKQRKPGNDRAPRSSAAGSFHDVPDSKPVLEFKGDKAEDVQSARLAFLRGSGLRN